MFTVASQLLVFIVLLVTGISMGIIFDFLRVLISRRRLSKYVVAIIDILFWILMTLLVIVVLVSSNWGEVRIYVFIFLGIGLWLHYTWISRYILNGYITFFIVSEKLIKRAYMILKKVMAILIAPFVLVFTGLKKLLFTLLGLVAQFYHLIARMVHALRTKLFDKQD